MEPSNQSSEAIEPVSQVLPNLQQVLSFKKCRAHALPRDVNALASSFGFRDMDVLCDRLSKCEAASEDVSNMVCDVVHDLLGEKLLVGSAQHKCLLDILCIINPIFHKPIHLVVVNEQTVRYFASFLLS